MDYKQVQRFSVAYKEQAQFEEMEQNVTAEDIKAALPIVRMAIADVGGMLDISRGTLEAYTEALKD